MAAVRINACRFTPATCSCEIEYGQYRDGTDYTTAYRTAETIITTCDEHALVTDPVALDAAIAAVNVPFSKACGSIRDYKGDNIGLVSWSVSGGIITMTVKDAPVGLKAVIDAIPELSITYTVS